MLLYFSVLGAEGLYGAGSAPDVGWFAYAPLTEPAFSRGHSTDYWILGLLVSGIGTIGTGVNIIATILCLRCPGQTLGRMPLLVWLYLVTAFLILIAMPPLSAAQIMLLVDRYLGGHFFDTQAGGSAVLWQHFFWIFGHPEVYILVLPAFGFVSEIIPVFSRKAIFGYPAMVGATDRHRLRELRRLGPPHVQRRHVLVGKYLLRDGDVRGRRADGNQDLQLAGHALGGTIYFKAPMLFCLAFLFQFLLAGLTGVMLGAVPLDWQLTDSYFVVAHFHYVIVGAIFFALFGAFYYWYPKMTGRMYDERLARWHFWLFVIGFHLTFDVMHVPGMLGMPRRIYTYEADRGWDLLNLIITVGVAFQAAGILCGIVNLVKSY